MKAKHFKQLKSELKYFDVWVAIGYHFNIQDKPNVTLLARNPCEAAKRAYRKGLDQSCEFFGQESDSVLGSFAVRPHEKKSIKFVTYWM